MRSIQRPGCGIIPQIIWSIGRKLYKDNPGLSDANQAGLFRGCGMEAIDYLYALNAASAAGYVPIVEEYDPESPGVILESGDNPEREAIYKDLLAHLSDEARYVLNLIWEAPIEAVTPKRGEVTANSLKRAAAKLFGEKRADKVFKELRTFVREAY